MTLPHDFLLSYWEAKVHVWRAHMMGIQEGLPYKWQVKMAVITAVFTTLGASLHRRSKIDKNIHKIWPCFQKLKNGSLILHQWQLVEILQKLSDNMCYNVALVQGRANFLSGLINVAGRGGTGADGRSVLVTRLWSFIPFHGLCRKKCS